MVLTIDQSGILSSSSGSPPSLIIPNGVKSIIKNCFLPDESVVKIISFENQSLLETIEDEGFLNLSALQKIDFRNCLFLQSIPDLCFRECRALEVCTLPDNGAIKYIGSGAFTDCNSLSFVNFPPSLELLGGWNEFAVFGNCHALKSIHISPSTKLKNISPHCFLSSGIMSFTLPKSVNVLSDAPFVGCKNIQYYAIEDGNSKYCLEDKFIYCDNKTVIAGVDPTISGNITIPSHVTAIINQAFRGCSITGISFSSSISLIGFCSFSSCESLIFVHIPSSITSIGESAFYGCKSLSYVKIDGTPDINVKAFTEAKISCGFGLSDLAKQKFEIAGFVVGMKECPVRTLHPRTTRLLQKITCNNHKIFHLDCIALIFSLITK